MSVVEEFMGMKSRISVLVLVAALVLAGCGRSGGEQSPAGSAPATAANESLLAFTATTLDGAPFDGSTLSGRPVVLWFWAPWCPTCLGQAPGVRKAVAEYGDKVAIVGVAGLDKTAAMPEFVRLAKVEAMTHLADEAGVVWKRFGVTAQSTFVLLDADGRITFKGRLSADEVPGQVAALLG
jgi:thiol-disulfide isomerase/thioredoxin